MKQIYWFLLFLAGFLCVYAQSPSQVKQSTIGLHFFYNDFASARKLNTTNFNNMEGGFGVDYMRGLTKNIDMVGTFNGSWVDYLLPTNTLYGSSNFLLDVNAGFHLKLLSDNHIFSPFLIAKANYSNYKNIGGISLLPGAGLQVVLFKEAFIFATVEYRTALSKSLSNQLYYSIGIATSIGKKKVKALKPAEIVPLPQPTKEAIIVKKDVNVLVIDQATGQALPYVSLTAYGPNGNVLVGLTDAKGLFVFDKLPAGDYSFNGVLNNIATSVQNVSTASFDTNSSEINVTITHNDPRFTLFGVVFNNSKNVPEADANISVTNITKNSITTEKSHVGDGVFTAQLEAESDFTVVGKKLGYISNIERLSTKELDRSTTLYVMLKLGIEEAQSGQSIVLNNIYFEVGNATIKTDFSSDLAKLVQFLVDNPDTRLEIEGHTDITGSVTLNNKLSQERANSVVEYLINNGVASNRLFAKGYGSKVPIASNSTAEGKAKNRRVEMKVL